MALTTLNILHFKEADGNWLDFVVANTEQPLIEKYDLVIGPVADDATLPVMIMLMETPKKKRLSVYYRKN